MAKLIEKARLKNEVTEADESLPVVVKASIAAIKSKIPNNKQRILLSAERKIFTAVTSPNLNSPRRKHPRK